MSFIRMENLGKTYRSEAGEVAALQELDFVIEEGSFLGIMGASGSGKSTLLTLLGALARPTSGRLFVDDIDVFAMSEEKRTDFRREYIGFVFQAYNLVPYLTAMENVMLPLAITDRKGAEQKRLALESLDKVGLAHRADHLPGQLSGGEQERVAIARALVNAPPLILADEPTGSLDTQTSLDIMDLFRDLNRAGQTILMVTHNSSYEEYFDRVLHLSDGRLDSSRDRAVISMTG